MYFSPHACIACENGVVRFGIGLLAACILGLE